MKGYKYVCTAASVRALLLFLLINRDASLSNTVFVFPKEGGIRGNLRDKLKNVIWLYRGNLLRRIYNYYKLKYLFKKMKLESSLRFGFDDGSWTEYIVHTTKSFNLIEDGLINYTIIENLLSKYYTSIFRRVLLHTPFMHIPYGLSNHISKIYLTGIAEIPQEIEKKVCIVNIKDLWSSCSGQRKQEILDIFAVDNQKLVTKGRSILLITQPLSEDKLMSEEDKMSIYKKVVDFYGASKILIKPHPREITDYKKIFPNAIVWESNFPIELIMLNQNNFGIKTVVSVYSSAIFLFEDCEKILLGAEAHPNLSFLKEKNIL